MRLTTVKQVGITGPHDELLFTHRQLKAAGNHDPAFDGNVLQHGPPGVRTRLINLMQNLQIMLSGIPDLPERDSALAVPLKVAGDFKQFAGPEYDLDRKSVV